MILALLMTFIVWTVPTASAETEIQLIIDGRKIESSVAPMIRNGRTLVPVRVVSEELGAQVGWNSVERTVNITKGNRAVKMSIDRYLIEYTIDGVRDYDLSDVAPKIFSGRTLVPLRLISNALGVGIQWDGTTRTVSVDSREASRITPFFDMQVLSIQPGDTVIGTTNLQASVPSPLADEAAGIKYLLITPETGNGFIIARGDDPEGKYQWLPAMRDNGSKVLVAALYDNDGKFLAGDALPVRIAIEPSVALNGLGPDKTINGAVSLEAKPNFSAAYVKYEINNVDKGKLLVTAEQDPAGIYEWNPPYEYNGNVEVKAVAYDQHNQPYPSQTYAVRVEVPRKMALTGVKSGQIIDQPVTLVATRNFDVSETEYFLRDRSTGAEQSLYKAGWGSYVWFPGPGISGNKELGVRFKVPDGSVYTSELIPVYVAGAPKLLLQGAGPDQVITSSAAVKLKVVSNVELSGVKYVIRNLDTGSRKVIAELQDVSREFAYLPAQGDSGSWKLWAVGTYGAGQTIASDEISITIYTGKIYPGQPVVEKSEFLGLASRLAVADAKESGMSAALQTAQAILETGWGQSVPVDKYSGQKSYNLFGIKGVGIAGSVTSNTWEEYNGVEYRIDAEFRAYYNIGQSWADHNRLLMTGARYEPYRKVMYDSTLGAWALKRSGYATDSKYPVKLIDIIQRYDLEELDKVSL